MSDEQTQRGIDQWCECGCRWRAHRIIPCPSCNNPNLKNVNEMIEKIRESISGIGPGYAVSVAFKPSEWRVLIHSVECPGENAIPPREGILAVRAENERLEKLQPKQQSVPAYESDLK